MGRPRGSPLVCSAGVTRRAGAAAAAWASAGSERQNPSAPYRIGDLQLSRGQFLRIDDHLRAGFLELIKAAALDILILHPQHARVLPFTVWRILDLADDG